MQCTSTILSSAPDIPADVLGPTFQPFQCRRGCMGCPIRMSEATCLISIVAACLSPVAGWGVDTSSVAVGSSGRGLMADLLTRICIQFGHLHRSGAQTVGSPATGWSPLYLSASRRPGKTGPYAPDVPARASPQGSSAIIATTTMGTSSRRSEPTCEEAPVTGVDLPAKPENQSAVVGTALGGQNRARTKRIENRCLANVQATAAVPEYLPGRVNI